MRWIQPQGLPGADCRQERRVAPGEVADALLVAGLGVELFAEFEMIAVEDDRLQHLIAGALQRRRGRGRCCRVVDSYLVEEPGGVGVERDRSGGCDRARQPVAQLGEVARRDDPGVVVRGLIAIHIVFVPRVAAEQRAAAVRLIGSVDRVVVLRRRIVPLAAQQGGGRSNFVSVTATAP